MSHVEVSRPPAQLPVEFSARPVLWPWQRLAIGGVALVAAGTIALWPRTGLIAMMLALGATCLAISIHQLAVSMLGVRHRIPPVEPETLLSDAELPVYTVLVPLYREAAVVPGLIAALERLDYPVDRLDVKLLVEADDPETPPALAQLTLGSRFEVLEVPPGYPQTKPKACNHGLASARGDLIVIFDAEDRPQPDQLRKAASAFATAGSDVACFQARLGFWNPGTNLITRYCTAEYCAIFEITRPGLEWIGAPIPLGGTSNHFPTALLRELGGWDAFNVTEDADLGIRLARLGYRTRSLDSLTLEEANSRAGNWIRQQSRWIKGYIQTWLVHMRQPRNLRAQIGAGSSIHFTLTMLTPVLPVLLAPLGWTVTLLWFVSLAGVAIPLLPGWLLLASAVAWLIGNAAGIIVWTVALRRCGHREIVPYTVLFHVHQLLKFVAAAKAIGQLVTRPSYWEKTQHGIDPAGLNAAG